jgi:hypothetical protein
MTAVNMSLSLSNVINVTVLSTPAGLPLPNINTIGLFTHEAPLVSWGDVEFKVYMLPSEVATDFGSTSETYYQALAIFSQNPNILTTGGYLVVIPRASAGAEKIETALARVYQQVFFFGVLVTEALSGGDFVNASVAMQTYDKIMFYGSYTAADYAATTGMFDVARLASKTHTRCLYYSLSAADARLMAAAYASRCLSVDFSGSLTSATMHLKSLATIVADPAITQTIITAVQASGVDVYPNIAGLPCLFTSGANQFCDEIYNELWFKIALQTAGFNYLKQTNYKIPQTESGITGLKGAYRQICRQAANCGFIAPGAWTSATTFGNPTDLIRNIADAGYYIYSLPVSAQSTADRTARKAPLVSIAIKAAGAVHQSNVIVNVNI